MSDFLYYLFPVLMLMLLVRRHVHRHRLQSRSQAQILREAVEAGLTEPPSLHPVVDLSVCVGSGACVRACPEKALGIIDGKGVLINPTHCMGHGACAASCPMGAIKLVFGTARRGVEIPQVTPDFETNVPGIFIAGELGGMGLIRNAVRQGTHAIGAVARRKTHGADYDVVIVGAGPAGIAASLAAQEAGLRYVTVEQEDSLGGTTYHYPRNKLVMTVPMKLPLAGEIKVREVSKEELMTIWTGVLASNRPNIRFGERMEEIRVEADGQRFVVRTAKDAYCAGSILLALGRRGTPRKLGVKGEELPKVVYRLIDAAQYRGCRVLVVGGGDSALEAALDISAEAGTEATLSYRRQAFDRVKPKNRKRMEAAVASGKVRLILESTVVEISSAEVTLARGEERIVLPNDVVIVCAGGELPTPMLRKIGIHVDVHYGT